MPPGRIDQVFLVASAPAVPVYPGNISESQPQAVPVSSAGAINEIPKIGPEQVKEVTPVKPAASLAEKLATRLTGATSEDWNHKTSSRNGGSREKPGTASEAGIPAKEGVPAAQTQGSPGQASVSTGEGITRVESESGFADAWYLTLLSRRLTERWNPAREGIAVVLREVTVSFTITRDGRIRDVGLARASGNPRFDRSGLTAVVESDFLPPLPASWGKKELQVSVRFREK
ncbi:MAG: TonB family protein [Candidatus Omnitrophica bacterium]|nr:TonB family protein [Candidatus Omnitrophota bacterium]